MLNEALKPVADLIESERLNGRAHTATQLLRAANVAVNDRSEASHWAWRRHGMGPVITIWAEWVHVTRDGHWMVVEPFEVDHRIGGQAWGPVEVPRAGRRDAVLREAHGNEQAVLAIVQTNSRSMQEVHAGEISGAAVRVRDAISWKVASIDEQRHIAVLIRGDGWAPTAAEIETAMLRWDRPASSGASAAPDAPILFVNIAWMARYAGHTDDDPVRASNFGYFRTAGHPPSDAHEQWTFDPLDGFVYGYVPRSSVIRVERLGAPPGADSVEGALVVFIARDPAEKVTKVVGWYEKPP